jgi:hypothetical protein
VKPAASTPSSPPPPAGSAASLPSSPPPPAGSAAPVGFVLLPEFFAPCVVLHLQLLDLRLLLFVLFPEPDDLAQSSIQIPVDVVGRVEDVDGLLKSINFGILIR